MVEENIFERKLVFFDFKRKAVVNPFVNGKNLEFINDYEDLLNVSRKINSIISDEDNKETEDLSIIFEKQTNLNNIVDNLHESNLNEFREIKL
jgi:hypothetical protein